MKESKWFIIGKSVLPEVFINVYTAKELLESGEAETASQAALMAGISRSAFYKYKDYIFSYNKSGGDKILTVNALLADKSGILSKFIGKLYERGANILTLHQNIPADNVAPVSISIRTNNLNCSHDELITDLKEMPGVKSITKITE